MGMQADFAADFIQYVPTVANLSSMIDNEDNGGGKHNDKT